MSGEPLFTRKGVTLLNVPHAQALADEVITEDCYELEALDGHWNILDIGACYGEFAIYAASKGHDVLAVEPSMQSFVVCIANIYKVNHPNLFYRRGYGKIYACRNLITGTVGSLDDARHSYCPEHPAGSGGVDGGIVERVKTATVAEMLDRLRRVYSPKPIMVKMDCEGAEVEIFRTAQDWIGSVDCVALEFHNHDAAFFVAALEGWGFSVKATGSGPRPRPIADSTIGGGLVIARRNK